MITTLSSFHPHAVAYDGKRRQRPGLTTLAFSFCVLTSYFMRFRSDKLRKRNIISTLLAVVLCMGCVAKVPLAPSTWDMAAKDFIPVPGRSNIYVFREKGGQGKSQLVQVFLDGRYVGGVAVGNYLLSETPPGVHSIAAFSHENQDSVNLRVEEGENYFLEIGGELEIETFRVTLRQVEEKTGRQGVMACKRVEGRKLFP